MALVDYMLGRKPTLTFHLGSYIVNSNAETNIENAFSLYNDAAVFQDFHAIFTIILAAVDFG